MRKSLLIVAACLFSTPAVAADVRHGGKLLLTDAVTSVEGAAGGGLASWAFVGGRATDAGIGGGAHATYVTTDDYDLTTYGAKLGLFDRLELSLARQSFDTRAAGAALGLGRGFTFGQDVFGAKLRILGDALYDQDSWVPQVAVGAQHKRADEGAVIRAVGGVKRTGTDFYLAASKIILSEGVVLNGTARWTRANQFGLLGHGGERQRGRSLQVEASAGILLSPSIIVGGEFRSKPNNLGFAREEDAVDLFAAFAVQRNLTLTAAYVDLGSIATLDGQRGLFLSLQGSF